MQGNSGHIGRCFSIAVSPVISLAASFTIYRENIVNAYIQGDRGGGNWSNIEVREYRTAEGNPAYCIQHNITGPGTGEIHMMK